MNNRYVVGEECWATVEGLRMRYLKLTPKATVVLKRPMVFVHGLLAYSFSWRHNLEEFASDRMVYAVDLPGVGFSDRIPKGAADLNFESTARRVLQFIAELGYPQVDLVGTSHGGAIATTMAYLDAQRAKRSIERLILVAPANPYSTVGRKRILLLNTPVGAWFLRTVHRWRIPLDAWTLARLYADRKAVTAETRSGYRAGIAVPGTIEYGLEIIRTWNVDMAALAMRLQKPIQNPTLLVWGDKDPIVPASSAQQLRRSFPNSQLTIMPNIGHLPYEEAPQAFNALLREFVDAAPQTAGRQA